MIVRKAANLMHQLKKPIIGVVENMSYFVAPTPARDTTSSARRTPTTSPNCGRAGARAHSDRPGGALADEDASRRSTIQCATSWPSQLRSRDGEAPVETGGDDLADLTDSHRFGVIAAARFRW